MSTLRAVHSGPARTHAEWQEHNAARAARIAAREEARAESLARTLEALDTLRADIRRARQALKRAQRVHGASPSGAALEAHTGRMAAWRLDLQVLEARAQVARAKAARRGRA